MMKTISLLILSAFLCVQFASTAHSHADEDSAPEPSICVMCLVSAQDDEVDLDLSPTPPAPFTIPNTLDFDLVILSDACFTLCREDVKVIEPPNLRSSAPRAPPV